MKKQVMWKKENLMIAKTIFLFPNEGTFEFERMPNVLLYRMNSKIVNPFDLTDQKPVLRYSNFCESRLVVENKTFHESGNCICYLEGVSQISFDQDSYTTKELEEFVLDNACFYNIRTQIAKKRLKKGKEPLRMLDIIHQDHKQQEWFEKKVAEFEAKEATFQFYKK